MLVPSLEAALRVATRLVVLDQQTGRLVPFELNGEQQRVLSAALGARRLVIGKGRQIGCSTVLCFLSMLIAILNPGLPVAIVADKQEKAEGLLGKIKSWLGQMGVELLVDNVRSIVLENGATFDALSAISHAEEGESRVGRTKSYGIIHATEQSFWRNAGAVWSALTSTMLGSALLWDESTGAPGETLFRSILENPGTKWEPIFFGVEEHANYRTDPSAIDDSTWEHLHAEFGFHERAAAAWWSEKLNSDFRHASGGTDVPRMLREYPVTIEHMFTFREGQHIQRWHEAPTTIDGSWNYYSALTPDEPVVFGIDTSAGIGEDASALAVIGHRSGRLWATWKDNRTPIPQFVPVLRKAWDHYRPAATVVESNGVGQAVWSELGGLDGACEQKSGSTNGEVQERRDAFRDAVEAGVLAIGGDLIAEAKSSTVKARRGADGRVRAVFEGKDDLISAASFAWKWRARHPYETPKLPKLEGHYYIEDRLKTVEKPTW